MVDKGRTHLRESRQVPNSLGIYVRMHSAHKDMLMAACDEELLGKEFCEGDLRLYVNPAFYKGNLVTEDDFRNLAKAATIGNFVGERCVELAIKIGVVHEDNVLRIEEVPHAQFVRL